MKRIPDGEPSLADLGKDAAPTPVKEESFRAKEPAYALENVILPAAAKERVLTLLGRIRNYRTLYEDWGLQQVDPRGKHVAVNFYGPPGTGKSMIAEALAAHLGKRILDISYAELESKYVGETGKNITKAFQIATREDAVLFFDEADSILGKRMTQVTQAADHGVNVARAVMLKQLDAFEGIVVFATNLAKNFDGAFVRRILEHIEMPLPDESCRRQLWLRMIPESVPGRASIDWDDLAQASHGLSGGEIKNAVICALSRAVIREDAAKAVTMDDFRQAIMNVKQAKRDVGSFQEFTMELPEETDANPPANAPA